MTQKGGQWRVDGKADRRFARNLAQAPSKVPVHPEPIAEIDLARLIAVLDQPPHRQLWAFTRRETPRADVNAGHV
jgi:hypothetical protein